MHLSIIVDDIEDGAAMIDRRAGVASKPDDRLALERLGENLAR